jgi:sortase A
MLLKVGVAVLLCSLMLAVVATADMTLRSEHTKPISEEQQPTAEKAAQDSESDQAKEKKINLGQKLEIDDEPDQADKATRSEEPRGAGGPERVERVGDEEDSVKKSTGELSSEDQPELDSDWPEPTADQVAWASSPRYYNSPSDTDMTLTIEALGLYDVPVMDSEDLEVLDRGLMHDPETSLPWDGGTQKNVFIAGHYLGWPGTASHLVFYNLDKLKSGDEMVLEGKGRVYKYRVSETFEATPDDSWVMGQERNRDMLTLQTCIPPTFEDRYIVRGDRI